MLVVDYVDRLRIGTMVTVAGMVADSHLSLTEIPVHH